MAHATITNQDARDLPHEDLMARVEALLSQYDAPTQPEEQADRIARLSRTIDEMPEIYRWLLELQSWMDHWTDAINDQMGTKDRRYKTMRQRRDFFEKMASAAKQRYEAASRLITIIQGFDPTGMPRQRRMDG